MQKKKAFSLLELSIAVSIIAFLIVGIVSGRILLDKMALESARNVTKNSAVLSIPNLVLWLEPTLDESFSSTSLSNNDTVATWNDLSGKKNNLTQTEDTKRPTYISSGINRLPSLQFNGRFLTNASGIISRGSSAYTMVAVWKQNVAGKSAIITQFDNNTCTGNSAGIMTDAVGMVGSFSCDNASYNYTPSLSVIQTPNISVVRVDKAQSTNQIQVFLNGVSQANNPTSVGVLSASTFGVGGAPTSANASTLNFNGNISEVMVFDRALSALEINVVHKYLRKKYFGLVDDISIDTKCSLANGVQIGNVIYNGSTTSVVQSTIITDNLACATGFANTNGGPALECIAGSGGGALRVNIDCTPSCTSAALTSALSSTNVTATANSYTPQGSSPTTLSCKAGYSSTAGTPSITCGAGGNWNPLINNCTQDCTLSGFNTILSNGHYTGTATSPYAQGSSVSLTCATGYSGSNTTTTCGLGGNWSVPTACVQQCLSSALTTALASTNSQNNGTPTYTNMNSPGSIACKSGYSATNGTLAITCGSNGNWNGISNDCTPNCTLSGFNTILSNGHYTGTATSPYAQGSSVSLTCATGYSGSNTTTTCGLGGNWSVPTACVQQCSSSTLTTALASTNSQNNGTPTYTNLNSPGSIACKSGYSATNGTPAITCGSNGNWNGISNDCTPNCSLYTGQTFENAICNTGCTSSPQGTVKTINCSQTIVNGTSPTITCGAGGVWSLSNRCCTNLYLSNGLFYGISGMYDGTGNRDGGVQWVLNSVIFSQNLYSMPGVTGHNQTVNICRYSFEVCGIYGCFKSSTVSFRCNNGTINFVSESRAANSCSGNWGRTVSIGSCSQSSFYSNYADYSGMFFNNANGSIYSGGAVTGNQCSNP